MSVTVYQSLASIVENVVSNCGDEYTPNIIQLSVFKRLYLSVCLSHYIVLSDGGFMLGNINMFHLCSNNNNNNSVNN